MNNIAKLILAIVFCLVAWSFSIYIWLHPTPEPENIFNQSATSTTITSLKSQHLTRCISAYKADYPETKDYAFGWDSYQLPTEDDIALGHCMLVMRSCEKTVIKATQHIKEKRNTICNGVSVFKDFILKNP